MGFCGIHLRLISQEVPKTSIRKIGLKNTLVKFIPCLPGANELTIEASNELTTEDPVHSYMGPQLVVTVPAHGLASCSAISLVGPVLYIK